MFRGYEQIHCLYLQLSSGSGFNLKEIEERLRSDIEQELEDLREYEMELKKKFFKMQVQRAYAYSSCPGFLPQVCY